jgi:glutathione peroxidase
MKKLILVFSVIALLLVIIKKKDMTFRQSLLKAVYPLLIAKEKLLGGKQGIIENKQHAKPVFSFYYLKAKTGGGKEVDFNDFKGKKVLLVNTASNCGYTQQYEELQELHTINGDNLVILAFPANDFREQEKGDDKEIEQFCKVNFGITFPLMQKSSVVKSQEQNEVFKWLTDKTKNGWNNKQPEWNFAKYLVDEEGVLTHYFSTKISPLSREVSKNL